MPDKFKAEHLSRAMDKSLTSQDGKQKSTCTGVMQAIDSHIRSRDTFGQAQRDLMTIVSHAEERLSRLAWFMEVGEYAKPKPESQQMDKLLPRVGRTIHCSPFEPPEVVDEPEPDDGDDEGVR